MTSSEYIGELLKDAGGISKSVEDKFGRLSPEQMNKKSSPESWSAAECFKHLLDTNQYYIQKAQLLFPTAPKIMEDQDFKHSLLGKLVIKSVGPKARKVKTAREFNPINSKIDPEIISEFLSQHKQIEEAIEKSRGIDIQKIKVVSPFAKFIKYHFGDAFKIILEHDKRHLIQAERAAGI